MKICLITRTFPDRHAMIRGGTETYVEILVQVLLARGDEVHVVVYGNRAAEIARPDLAAQFHVVSLSSIRYLSGIFPNLAEAWQLGRFVGRLDRREHFDALEGGNEEGLLYFAGHRFGDRLWLRLHSSLRQHIENKRRSLTWPRRFAVWLDGAAVRRSVHRVTHSRAHAAEMAREYRVPIESIAIVPHATTAPLDRESERGPAREFTYAYLGTLDQRKGIDLFLRAIPRIHAAYPKARFLVIGRDGHDSPSGSWREWFENTGPDPTLRKLVEFRGPVANSDLETCWSEISAAVVPSRYESFGYVVIEAFARGKPVLAARAGALPEVARDGALLVEPGNWNALADGAIRLQAEPAFAQSLARRGRELYEQHYTLAQLGENILRLYSSAPSETDDPKPRPPRWGAN